MYTCFAGEKKHDLKSGCSVFYSV